jgi:hypothetical protein
MPRRVFDLQMNHVDQFVSLGIAHTAARAWFANATCRAIYFAWH